MSAVHDRVRQVFRDYQSIDFGERAGYTERDLDMLVPLLVLAAQDERSRPLPGDIVHGFASGLFGRDSYHCRRIEQVGPDWLVARDERGRVETITIEGEHEWKWLMQAIASRPEDCWCGGQFGS